MSCPQVIPSAVLIASALCALGSSTPALSVSPTASVSQISVKSDDSDGNDGNDGPKFVCGGSTQCDPSGKAQPPKVANSKTKPDNCDKGNWRYDPTQGIEHFFCESWRGFTTGGN